MQVVKHSEHIDKKDACTKAHTHLHVGWHLFIGVALLLASYIAQWLYPEDPIISELSAVLGALVLAVPILSTAFRHLIEGLMHMDELVALAVLAAMAQGDFRTAGIVSFFMLISLLIETRTAHGAHKAIEGLVRLSPTLATRINKQGQEESIPSLELCPGNHIRIRPGENVPADGIILEGKTSLNESTITGESEPRDKEQGDEVFAGTQNLTGAVVVEVRKVGKDTTLGKVKELILAAEQTKLPFVKIVDRYAGYYTPVALMLALLVWFSTGEWSRLVALLVISCPCAFILATPTAMVAALSAAARHGILFKNVVDLEASSRINTMIFDKTGTLTTGELGVYRLAPAEGVEAKTLLGVCAHAEQYSRHPAALAILKLVEEAGIELKKPTKFHEESGQGVRATVENKDILCGRLPWVRKHISTPNLDIQDTDGLSAIFVVEEGKYLGWIGLRDQLRGDAKKALDALRELKIHRISMITGDRVSVAENIVKELDNCEFFAECLPQEKTGIVKELKEKGFRVAFVGDGVNDAPALAASDTGIAMGAAGSDVAIHSASVALMNNDLMRIPYMIHLSRAARITVFQNLSIGAGFILGGLVFSGLGWLNPIMAAIMHNAGSLLVISNSARLVRFGEIEESEDDG